MMDNTPSNTVINNMQSAQPPMETKPFESELMGLLNIFAIVRERLWWGLISAFVLSCSFLFYTFTQPKLYESNASIIIDNKTDKVVEIQQVVDTGLQNEKELVNYEEQMRSRRFADYVVESFSPAERAKLQNAYRDEDGNVPGLLGFLGKSGLTIKRNGQVFKVYGTHRDPECAALLANRFVERYIAFQLERSDTSNSSAMLFLEDQVSEMRRRVEIGESALQAYRAKYNMVSLEDSQNLVVQRMKSLSEAMTVIQVEKLTVDTQAAQIENIRLKGDFLRLLDIPTVNNFPGIMDTFDNLEEARAEKAKLGAIYKARHPRMVEIEAKIAKQSDNLNQGIEMAIAGVKHRQTELNDRLVQIKTELNKAEKNALDLDRMAIDYNVLRRQIDTDKQTFEQMLTRRNDTAISSRLSNTNVRILDIAKAPLPDGPKYPNRFRAAIIALALICFGLFGVPYGVDLLDNRLKSCFDIEAFLRKPALGDLPLIKGMKRNELSRALLNNSDSDIVEMFRSVFATIGLQIDNRPNQVFLVTSTVPAEGKTFFSANLAGVFAKHGSKTLIIDADFRRPSMHRALGVENKNGLVPFLSENHAAQATLNGNMPNLGVLKIGENCFFLPSGGSANNATELFDSKLFTDVMQRLRKEYDTIIIDTPPTGIFPDVLFLAAHADHTIYVARFNLISRQRIKHVIQDIDETPAKVLGVVINGRNSRKGIRYGYGYNYNYSYGHYYNGGYGYSEYDRKKYRRHYQMSEKDKTEADNQS